MKKTPKEYKTIQAFIEYTLRDLDVHPMSAEYSHIYKEAINASDILDLDKLERFIEDLVNELCETYDPETYYR